MANAPYQKIPWLMYLITTVIITASLFYVDEGFYNFKWITSWGNWYVFLIYGFAIFVCQILVYLLLTRVFKVRQNNLLVILLGASIAVMFLVTVVFG